MRKRYFSRYLYVTQISGVFTGSMPFIMMMVIGLGGLCAGLSAVAVRMKKAPVMILFMLSFVCAMAMGYMSSRDSTLSWVNWAEQSINTVSQMCLMLGVIALHKAGPAVFRPPSEPEIHNTMELEERMLSCVEHGRTEDMLAMFRAPAAGRAGEMATDALRQQKNLLICTATLVTRAAIRGGMNREQAFALSDMYIQKAELMSDVLSLTRLNAQLVLDFTKRVEADKAGIHHSGLIRKARDHILSHIGETISTETLSKALGMNRTYLCKLFVEETGLTVNQYVTQVRLEEARRLMDITRKPIAEIAEYVGCSSQSYFQKLFKKQYALTPGAYRKRE